MSDERKVVDITELGNPAKPQGTYGIQMLRDMNEHHSSVTEWGLSFLDISDDAAVLEGFLIDVVAVKEGAIDGDASREGC